MTEELLTELVPFVVDFELSCLMRKFDFPQKTFLYWHKRDVLVAEDIAPKYYLSRTPEDAVCAAPMLHEVLAILPPSFFVINNRGNYMFIDAMRSQVKPMNEAGEVVDKANSAAIVFQRMPNADAKSAIECAAKGALILLKLAADAKHAAKQLEATERNGDVAP